MTVWEFDSGIVATRNKSFNVVFQRIFYVKYRSGNTRRLITAAFVYSKMKDEDKKKFINSLLDEGEELKPQDVSKMGRFVKSMSKVASIMDFDIREKDQSPEDPKSIEHVFEHMSTDIQDSENHLSILHFEKYLPECDVSKCVCTLTNDEESTRRITDVLNLETISPETE
jgi:hypothetical protein